MMNPNIETPVEALRALRLLLLARVRGETASRADYIAAMDDALSDIDWMIRALGHENKNA